MSQSKVVNWYKAELYGSPLITYLIAADSIEQAKKSFGCLAERYRINYLDYDGMKMFFADKVLVTAVKTNTGCSDIMFVKDEEICILRILL